MTKSEVIKEFFKKSVLPVAVAALLYCIFKSACTKDGVTDYVWLSILCGLPFGIPRMFAWIVPGGSLGTALPLFLLNFIIGGVIGGFVLVWRLLVAAWYIPLTIYRLFITRGTSYIPEWHYGNVENGRFTDGKQIFTARWKSCQLSHSPQTLFPTAPPL